MFHLIKWYGDCVDAQGRASIFYWAQLHWRALRLRYASRLDACPGSPLRTRTTLRAGVEPSLFRLSDARFTPREPSFSTTLYRSPQGDVRWQCLAPSAEVVTADGLSGSGYLERLEMTLPPAALPLRTLRWGRWIGDADSLTWIEWQGPHPLRLVLRRGQAADPALLDELQIDAGRTLRDGPLASIPGLRPLLPAWLARAHESKWLSPATLDGASGWALHEVVQWR